MKSINDFGKIVYFNELNETNMLRIVDYKRTIQKIKQNNISEFKLLSIQEFSDDIKR